MLKQESISVIIRTFDRLELLRLAISSVLSQTLLPQEIIIVDDASTDATPAFVAELAKQHKEIHYIRLEVNRGMDITQQIGFERSTGEYIAFLDSDDIWLEDHLEQCIQAFKKNPKVNFVFAKYGLIDKEGNCLVPQVHEPELLDSSLNTILLKEIIIQPTRCLIRRKSILEIGGIPLCGIAGDWVLNTLVASISSNGISQLPKCTTLMRIHETQSYSRPDEVQDCLLRGTEHIFRFLPEAKQSMKPHVISINLLHSAFFYWQSGVSKAAWLCLGRSVRTYPRSIFSRDFRVVFPRLFVHPSLGSKVRQWRRNRQRKTYKDLQINIADRA